MTKKLMFFLLTVIVTFGHITYAYATIEHPDITATSYIVMDAKTGAVLDGKNIHEQVYPASTTKIMTIMLALKYGDLDATITMTEDDIYSLEEGASTIYLVPGEEISLRDGLYAAAIPSANDACNGIAHTVCDTTDQFIELMNNEVVQLGATQTHFSNPHGLHEEDHYTTAYDLALIMKAGIQVEGFKEVLSTTSYNIPQTNLSIARNLTAFNNLLRPESMFYLDGIQASKPGFTYEAQHTLITYATREDKELIVAIFGVEDTDAQYQESHILFDYGFENYDYISTEGLTIPDPTLTLPETYHFYSDNYLDYTLPTEILANVDTTLYPIEVVVDLGQFSVNSYEGQAIGSINYIQNEEVLYSTDIVLTSGIFRFQFIDLIMWILLILLALVLLLILGAFGLRQYVRVKRRKQRRMRRY